MSTSLHSYPNNKTYILLFLHSCRYLLGQGADPGLLTEEGETVEELVEEGLSGSIRGLLRGTEEAQGELRGCISDKPKDSKEAREGKVRETGDGRKTDLEGVGVRVGTQDTGLQEGGGRVGSERGVEGTTEEKGGEGKEPAWVRRESLQVERIEVLREGVRAVGKEGGIETEETDISDGKKNNVEVEGKEEVKLKKCDPKIGGKMQSDSERVLRESEGSICSENPNSKTIVTEQKVFEEKDSEDCSFMKIEEKLSEWRMRRKSEREDREDKVR